MTKSDAGPALREVAQTAARTSDAGAELLASLTGMGCSLRAACTAGCSIPGIGRELRRGRAQARYRRAQNRILPSVRLMAHSAEVIAAAAAHGLSNVRVFGSCARGSANLASDVDLIVDIGPRTSLLDLSRFAIGVEGLLGLDEGRADVVTGDALRPDAGRAGERIAAEAQPLAAWAAGWPRLDSLPGWVAARDAGASDEELADAAENGLAPWSSGSTSLRSPHAGRSPGATLIDPDDRDHDLVRVTRVLDRYAAARTGGLDHDAALTRAVTRG